MNFKIIVGILLQMALLASCLLAIDPTQPGDYHKQYLGKYPPGKAPINLLTQEKPAKGK
jgi:hypothetical protein